MFAWPDVQSYCSVVVYKATNFEQTLSSIKFLECRTVVKPTSISPHGEEAIEDAPQERYLKSGENLQGIWSLWGKRVTRCRRALGASIIEIMSPAQIQEMMHEERMEMVASPSGNSRHTPTFRRFWCQYSGSPPQCKIVTSRKSRSVRMLGIASFDV
jgi:hypothetical protein